MYAQQMKSDKKSHKSMLSFNFNGYFQCLLASQTKRSWIRPDPDLDLNYPDLIFHELSGSDPDNSDPDSITSKSPNHMKSI